MTYNKTWVQICNPFPNPQLKKIKKKIKIPLQVTLSIILFHFNKKKQYGEIWILKFLSRISFLDHLWSDKHYSLKGLQPHIWKQNGQAGKTIVAKDLNAMDYIEDIPKSSLKDTIFKGILKREYVLSEVFYVLTHKFDFFVVIYWYHFIIL